MHSTAKHWNTLTNCTNEREARCQTNPGRENQSRWRPGRLASLPQILRSAPGDGLILRDATSGTANRGSGRDLAPETAWEQFGIEPQNAA